MHCMYSCFRNKWPQRIQFRVRPKRNMFGDASLACAVFYCALAFARGDINKTRLCLQYEIDDYNSSMIPLKTLSGVNRSVCFMECVRHQMVSPPCRAFHFRPVDGICELLPGDIPCMVDNTTPGTTYVHLSECESVAPWRAIKPDHSPIQWITNVEEAFYLRSPLGADRYVIRVLHKGMWLPGFRLLTATSNVAGPDGVRISCLSNIQYIKSSDPAPYQWIPFAVGDPVPVTAIVSGYWPNATPLYIVHMTSTNANGVLYSGYYNEESRLIRPNYGFRPGSLQILVKGE